jgi:DNA-directed RNA polymerase specialized sigma subunit
MVSATQSLSDMPRSSSPDIQRMESGVVRLTELQGKVNEKLDKLIDLKKEVFDAIEQLKDRDQRIILRYRYLCFKSWREIESEVYMSLRTVYRMHDLGLIEMSKILNSQKDCLNRC